MAKWFFHASFTPKIYVKVDIARKRLIVGSQDQFSWVWHVLVHQNCYCPNFFKNVNCFYYFYIVFRFCFFFGVLTGKSYYILTSKRYRQIHDWSDWSNQIISPHWKRVLSRIWCGVMDHFLLHIWTSFFAVFHHWEISICVFLFLWSYLFKIILFFFFSGGTFSRHNGWILIERHRLFM